MKSSGRAGKSSRPEAELGSGPAENGSVLPHVVRWNIVGAPRDRDVGVLMLWLEHSGHSRCCVWWVRERDQKTGGVQTEGVF